jgi:ubiquinone/menaquinone biosynthesis C-methylase UbiE
MRSFATTPTLDKSDLVKAVFEEPGRYLNGRRFDIRIRAETVQAMIDSSRCSQVLDIGCGDGSISLPLLNPHTRITLLDFSTSMLSLAQSNIPPALAANGEVRNEDFMKASFEAGSFDLIICVGVLAHVESPDALLGKIAALLSPGGRVILEFTDSYDFMGRLSSLMAQINHFVAPRRSPVNLLSRHQVDSLCERRRFRTVSMFRYALPPLPGIQRILTQRILYRLVRLVYGTFNQSRNSWMGNEYICLLTSAPTTATSSAS